jgi:predicted transcriptional regulator
VPTIAAHVLGPTELQIMALVWSSPEPLTAHHVHTALASQSVTYTTIMTTMERLADTSILQRGDGRPGVGGAYRYTPAISRGALLVAAFDQLATQIAADHLDRAEALGLLAPPKTESSKRLLPLPLRATPSVRKKSERCGARDGMQQDWCSRLKQAHRSSHATWCGTSKHCSSAPTYQTFGFTICGMGAPPC